MRLPKECEGCRLASTAQGFCKPSPVNNQTKLRAWGEAPGATEVEVGVGFTGDAGRLLRQWLQRGALKVAAAWPNQMPKPGVAEEVAFSNVVLCKRPGNAFPLMEDAHECLRRHGHASTDSGACTTAPTGQAGSPRPTPSTSTPPSSSSQIPWIAYGNNAIESLTGYRLPIQKVRGSLFPVLRSVTSAASESPSGKPSAQTESSSATSTVSPTSSTPASNAAKSGTSPQTQWLVAALHPAFLVRGGAASNPNEEQGKAQDHLQPTLGADALRAITCPAPRVPTVTYLRTPADLRAGPPAGAVVSLDIEGANGQPNIVGVAWEEDQAYVFPWSEALHRWLLRLYQTNPLVGHNMAYDLPELAEAGVPLPDQWYDTINMAALYDPDQPMNLQTQVLTHVPGSITWKGLVSHDKGYDYAAGDQGVYRDLWMTVLTRLGRPFPADGYEWYCFYNGLDTAWSLTLYNNLRRKLEKQGRWNYYVEVMQPLQKVLIEIGRRGMPIDMARVEEHRRLCQTYITAAANTLAKAGRPMLEQSAKVEALYMELENVRAEHAAKPTPHREKRIAAKLEKIREALIFNPESNKQRADLLFDWYGLPLPRNRRSADEESLDDLRSRLLRGTAKPQRAEVAEVMAVLEAMGAAKKWGVLESTFLQPELRDGRVITSYTLHRSASGRLASGADSSDPDKLRGKVTQLQNVPRKVRDIVVATPGHLLVGGDYAGIEWAIAMWMAGTPYHIDMLDKFWRGEFDPHRYLAAIANGIPESEVTPEQRKEAKAYTHGRTFMGSEGGLSRAAGHPYKVAVKVCAGHEEAFRLRKWQEDMIALCKKRHYVQTPLGWRRYFWAWNPDPKELIATAVSGTAADLLKTTKGVIAREKPESWELLTSTHDSIMLMVPQEAALHAQAWLKRTMERQIPWLDNRQWRADVRAGVNWKEVS